MQQNADKLRKNCIGEQICKTNLHH